MKIDLDDITIVPAVTSEIRSRSSCYYLDDFGCLPLMVSPMDTVIDEKNFRIFSNVYRCIPRGVNEQIFYDYPTNIKSFGLNEIIPLIDKITKNTFGETVLNHDDLVAKLQIKNKALVAENHFYDIIGSDNILIDIANGHMADLPYIIKMLNTLSNNECHVYVGNVANPQTYKVLAEAGAYGVRLNIGSGQACLTAVNTAVFYPIASLIKECKEIKDEFKFNTKIIADGGCKNYSDIIKCLALGADLVMLGSLFNKCIESSGQKYIKMFSKYIKIKQKFAKYLFTKKIPVYTKYRGMSTKEVQKKWKKSHIVTAEGTTRIRKVEYTYKGFIENFIDYLRSAMSYTNCKTLDEFIGKVQIVEISENSYKRFNK